MRLTKKTLIFLDARLFPDKSGNKAGDESCFPFLYAIVKERANHL